MEIGKREAPKTRRASDGTVEWRCTKCLLFKPIAKFVKVDERRGYVCGACDSLDRAGHRNTKAFILDQLLAVPCKPVNAQIWDRAVWKHVRKHLLPIECEQKKRNTILNRIRAGRFKNYHVGLMGLLASKDLKRSDEYFWFVFQKGLLDIQTLRLYAVGAAKYIAQLSCLYTQDTRVADVLFEARHVAIAQEGHLNTTRQVAYDICETLQKEYNPLPTHKAAMALTATCFPDSYEAALAATGWAVESWLSMKGLLEQSSDNSVAREEAVRAFLRDLSQLVATLAQAWIEDRTQEAQKKLNKFVSGEIDYDAIDD
jgi:hypothetical protein